MMRMIAAPNQFLVGGSRPFSVLHIMESLSANPTRKLSWCKIRQHCANCGQEATSLVSIYAQVQQTGTLR